MHFLISTARVEIADYMQSLIFVYTMCILGWIVTSLVFSLGMRVPYARWVNVLLDFLRDVSEPYLRIFRRLGLRAGPFDLSPIIGLLVLQFGGNFVVRIIQGG